MAQAMHTGLGRAWLEEPPRHAAGCSRSRAVQARAARSSSVAQPVLTAKKVQLSTASDCELAVSRYPMFSYNAAGGGGSGSVVDLGNGQLQLTFDPDTLNIPALNWRTASVFGVPIPPPLQIAIQPRRFQGTLDTATGEVNMEFEADFEFTVGPLYKAPPLKVATTLTSESSSGHIHSSSGSRLKDGSTRLVGVARVPKVHDPFMDTFLMLPTDALAIMKATLDFS